MSIASIRPSTVDGIKQLAKKIKREQHITHSAALDIASRQAGFQKFAHANRQLTGPRVFPVYLTAHWVARRGEKPQDGLWAGRELLRVELSRPLPELVAKHRVSAARGLDGFRMEYADHLEHLTNVSGQDGACKKLLTAARSLRFMEATGLQPVTTQAMRQQANALRKLPNRDHTSSWFDPATNAVLLLDEPYAGSGQAWQRERQDWASAHGVMLRVPEWEGIYYPGNCTPHLVSRDAGLVDRVASALAGLSPVVIPDPWPHPTARNGEDFLSPLREADAKPRKPRPGPSYRNYMGATPYGGAAGIPSRWRPIQSMPMELHRRLGVIFQSNIEAGLSYRVIRKLEEQRSNLDAWMSIEQSTRDDDVYYGGPSTPLVEGVEEQRKALAEARSIVERGYNDCKPRRELIAALDAASAELSKRQAA